MPTYCLVLQPKSTTRNAQLNDAALSEGKPNATMAGTILRRTTAPELIGTYKYGSFTLHLFGYKSGKAGTENKHELPPPHDKVLLFGEAVLFSTSGNKFASFNDTEYKKWYNTALGGFEELGDEDSEDEDDDGDGEEEDEEEEEVADTEEEDVEEEVEVMETDEEEEVVRKPVPKISKAKRNLKKIPAWYSTDELMPEPYKLVKPN